MTPHTIHVGALENYTKSKNITKVVNRTLIGNRGMERTNVTIIFANKKIIRTSKWTYYLLYNTSHSKTHTTVIPLSILLKILASPAKKKEK